MNKHFRRDGTAMNEQNKNRKKRSSKKRWSTKKKIILNLDIEMQ